MKPRADHFSRLVTVAALGVSALLAARVLWHVALPTGSLVVRTDFASPAPYVSDLKPAGRMEEPLIGSDGIARTEIISDPIYLDLKPPSSFESATVTVRYENPDGAPVDLAALAGSLDGAFDRRLLERPLLDRLPWKRVSSGRLSLYSRRGGYASVDDFLRAPPSRSTIAIAGTGASFLPPVRLEGYVPLTDRREITVSLRGAHELVTYVKDETLDVAFTVQDMNRQEGADPVTVSVWKGDSDELVARVVLPDDGNAKGDQRSTPLRTIPVTVLAPAEGHYRITFVSDDDVFIRKLSTRQRKLSFRGGIYLGDHVGFSDQNPSVTLYVRGRRLDAVTHHPEGLQKLDVGDAALTLVESHGRVGRRLISGDVRVVSPKRDVVLATDGVFAFSRDDLFDPGPFELPWFASMDDLDVLGIDHVLAAYEPPRQADGAKEASATFDLASLDRTVDGTYRLALSLPAIAESGHPFKLRSVRVAFSRSHIPFMDALRDFFVATPPTARPDGKVADPIHFREYVP